MSSYDRDRRRRYDDDRNDRSHTRNRDNRDRERDSSKSSRDYDRSDRPSDRYQNAKSSRMYSDRRDRHQHEEDSAAHNKSFESYRGTQSDEIKRHEDSSSKSGNDWDPVKEAEQDMSWARIYISNLPSDITVEELQETFGAIGIVAREKQKRGYKDQWPYKIKLYTDSDGGFKGDAVLTYEDANAARTAPTFFNGHEIRGKVIKVELAGKPEPPAGGWNGPVGSGAPHRGGGARSGGERDYRGRGGSHSQRHRPY